MKWLFHNTIECKKGASSLWYPLQELECVPDATSSLNVVTAGTSFARVRIYFET